jgi:hypothetical protein
LPVVGFEIMAFVDGELVGVSRIFDDENIIVTQEVDFKAVSSI